MGIKPMASIDPFEKLVISKLQAKTFSRAKRKRGESAKDFLIRVNKKFIGKKERFEKAVDKERNKRFNRSSKFL